MLRVPRQRRLSLDTAFIEATGESSLRDALVEMYLLEGVTVGDITEAL